MRRADREMLDPDFMQDVLDRAYEIYIALNTGSAPYVLPVNHVFHEGSIYFHCAPEGRKIDLIRQDSQVGFTAAVDVLMEKTTTHYRSVCGNGVVEPLNDIERKHEVFKAFSDKYKSKCIFPIPDEKLARINIFRINIKEMTGKYSKPAGAN